MQVPIQTVPTEQLSGGGLPTFQASAVEPVKDFGPQQGMQLSEGAQKLGTEMNMIGQHLQNEYDDATSKTLVTEFMTRANDLSNNPDTGFMLQIGSKAVNGFPAYMQSLQDLRSSISDKAGDNSMVKFLFNRQADVLMSEFKQRANTHYVQQSREYNRAATKSLLDAQVQLTTNDSSQKNWDRLNALSTQFAVLNGAEPGDPISKALSQDYASQVITSQVKSLLSQDKLEEAARLVNRSWADGLINQGTFDNLVAVNERVRKQAVADTISNLEIAFINGTLTKSMLDKARPLIKDGPYATLLRQLEHQNQTALKDAQYRQIVIDKLSGKQVIPNFDDPEQRKAGDAVYDTVFAPQYKDSSPEVQNSATMNFISKTGMVPKSVIGSIKNVFLSANSTPDQITQASDMLDRIMNWNAFAIDAKDHDLAKGMIIARQVGEGIDVAQARKNADVLLDPSNQPAVKARDAAFRQIKQEDLSKQATGIFSSWVPFGFKLDPTTTSGAAVVADYTNTLRDRYLQTGDLKEAQVFATKMMQSKYGHTQFPGGVAAFPPEKYYSLGDGDDSWMLDQAADFVESLGYKLARTRSSDAMTQTPMGAAGKMMLENIDTAVGAVTGRDQHSLRGSVMLIPDRVTSTQASTGSPTYHLMYKSTTGEWRLIDGVRWNPVKQMRIDELREHAAQDKAKANQGGWHLID